MTVRSLGLALVLAMTAFACSDPGTPPATDETTGAASEDGAKAPAPATDTSKPETSTPAPADTPATTTNKPADKATTPAKDTNEPAADPAPGGAGDPAAKLGALKACVEGCGQDTECVKTCLTDLAGGAGLPELPGG